MIDSCRSLFFYLFQYKFFSLILFLRLRLGLNCDLFLLLLWGELGEFILSLLLIGLQSLAVQIKSSLLINISFSLYLVIKWLGRTENFLLVLVIELLREFKSESVLLEWNKSCSQNLIPGSQQLDHGFTKSHKIEGGPLEDDSLLSWFQSLDRLGVDQLKRGSDSLRNLLRNEVVGNREENSGLN